MHNGKHIFNEEEDERLASILDAMIDQGLLPHQEIVDWLSGVAQCCSRPRSRSQRIAQVNSKNVIRCLFFRRKQDCNNGLAAALVAAEAKLNRFAV
nr:DUF2785 domain-containing protein [Paenibacillus dendritiformis]